MSARSFALWVTLAACAVGCSKKPVDDTESKRRAQWVKTIAYKEDAGQSWELMTRDTVQFGDGWYPTEHLTPLDTRTESWRWMGHHSIIHLDTGDGSPHHLVIGGGIPPGSNHVSLTFTIDGAVLDVHIVDRGWLLDTVIPPDLIHRRVIDLGITASASLVPPMDGRELGASVTVLRWDPVR